jgi:hypothetical protein
MILRDLMVRTGRRASQSMECLSKILRLKRSGARQLELVSMEDRLLFSAAPGPAPEAPADNAQIESVIMASLEAPIEILSDGTAEESDAANAQGLQPLGLDVNTSTETHELVFIDTGAANYQDLLDDLWTHQDPDRHIDVVLLSSGEDGIAQITETLAQYKTEKLDAIHLVTHGADRAIKLGNTWLDATKLDDHRDQIASWGDALNPGADLLIYGCDLAGNDLGRALLNNLVDLTGADIAASIDETGSSPAGGDRDLEYDLGEVTSEVPSSGLLQADWDALLQNLPIQTLERQELVFVDTSVTGYQQIVDDLVTRDVTGTRFDVVLLDPQRDGISQIGEALVSRTGIDALHLVSHGTDGRVLLGDFVLDAESLNARTTEIAAWSNGLSSKADILLYGCDVAADGTGRTLVDELARLTGADVAASTDATGQIRLGGDWDLEYRAGQVETKVAFSAAFQDQWNELLPTYQQFTNYTSELEIKSDANQAQTFTHTSGSGTYVVNQLSLAMRREASGYSSTYTVTLQSSWNGAILATSGPIASSTLGTSLAFVDVNFGNVTLTDGTPYTIRVTTNDTNGKVYVGLNSSGGYSGGTRIDVNGSPLPSEDLAFKVASTAAPGVTVDASSSIATDGVTSLNVPHTTSGTNRLMLVSVATDPHGESVSSITYDGISLNRVGFEERAGSHSRVEIWSLVAPSTGTHNVDVTLTGTSYHGVAVGVMTFNGVNQTTPLLDFGTASGRSTAAAVTVTSAADDLVFGAVHSLFGTGVAPGAGQTEYWDKFSDQSNGSGSAKAGATTVTSSWTVNNDDWSAAAVSIQADTNTAVIVSASAVKDAYIRASTPTANNGLLGSLVVDRESTDLQRALMQFDLSAIPTNAIIVSATLKLHATAIGGTLNIAAYQLQQPWTETGVTWNQSSSGVNWSAAGGAYNATPLDTVTTNATGEHAWDITSLAQDWVATTQPNYGVVVASPDGGGNRTATYDSREGAVVPVLELIYIVPNSPPAATNLSAAQTYTEDSVLNLTDIVISDADGDNVTATLTLSDIDAGRLNIGTSGAVTSTYNAGTGVWSASGAIADVNNLLAALNFTPSSNFNSNFTIATSISDDVTGAITGSKMMSGTAVNDEQVLSVFSGLTVAENSTGNVIDDTRLLTTDVDNSSSQIVYTLTSVTSNGALRVNGTALANGSTFTQANITAGLLTYDHDGSETSNDSFSFSVDDGSGAASTGTFNLTVTPVNDNNPVITSNNGGATASINVAENSTFVTTVTASNADLPAQTLTYSISGGADETKFSIDSNTGVLTFVAAPNREAPSDVGGNNIYDVQVAVSDGTLTDVQDIAVTVTNVNEAPIILINSLSISEGTTVLLTDTQVNNTDPDNTPAQLTYTASAVNGGLFELIASPGAALTSFTQAQINAGEIQFVHDGGETAPSYQLTVSDGSLSDGPSSVTIGTFTNVNDGPVIAANTLTITEGATVVLSNLQINATDPDNTPAQLTYTASSISGGRFELVASPGTAITSFTQAQINSGAVQFVHDGGELAPSYQLTVSDGSLSDGPITVAIGTFTNTNDAPTVAFGQGDITHTEGNSTSTIDGAVSVTDIDSADFAGGTLTVNISGGDASDQSVVQHQGTGVGQVSVSGFNLYVDSGLGSVQVGTWSGGSGSPLVITFTSAATATEVMAVANAIGFQNLSSNPSSADRSVQFLLTDGDGGTSAAATKTIHFTTVNTAPTVSGPPAVTTNVGTLVTFSSTNGNAVSVNDPDAGSSPIQVRLSVTTGRISLSTTAGLTFSVGNGVSNQTMTLTGTVAAIQAAMEGLKYTPQSGFSGADRLIVEVNDLGNSGTTGSPLTDSRGVNIYVGTVPFLQGNYLDIGFNAAGSLGSALNAPTGYQSVGSTLAAESDPERDGGTYDGDFILPGSPEEGWGVHVGGTTYSNNTVSWGVDEIVGTWGAIQDTGTAQSMTWNGSVGGVNISSQHTVLRDGLYLEIVVTLTNSTASTLSDLYYYRNVDPDNNYYQNSNFETTNTIISQGDNGTGRSEVTATQPDGSFMSLTGFGTDSRVTYGGFSNRDPLAIYNGTGLSQTGTHLGDEAISLAFHVPTLAAGQSTTLTLRYTFGNEAAPDVDLDGNDSTATGLNYQGLFVEDGGPVAIVDSDMSLFDADNDVLQGMTITLTNALDGVLESLAATTTGTNISASYDSGTGVLTLAGQDTLANYRHVLSSVVYDNSANTPNTTSRVITIAVSDGAHTSPVATSTIDVLATNDPPVLLTNTLSISEGGTVVLSSSNINSSDPESPATGLTYTVSNLTGGHFESIASGATITSFTQDQIDNGGIQFVHDGGEAAPNFSLTLSDGAQSVGPSAAVISFSNVNDSPVTGTASATANEDFSPITVVLGGADVDGTINQVQVATLPANGVLYLDAAMTIPVVAGTDYATTAGQLSVYFAPTLNWNGVTTFTFAAIDNTGAIDATPATATITVNAVNDAPVVTLSTTAIEFTENNPVGLMVDLVVTDVDSATLTSATMSITANFVAGEDQLAFTNMLGITGNYNAATGVLTLTGTASLADYQTALRSIAYFNPSDNPTTAARQFQVVVSDGASPSVAVSRSININRVNDAPTIVTNALTITEGATVVLTAANLQSSDPDNSPTQLSYTVASSLGGQFEFVATPGVAITSFTQDDINNSLVQFVHDGGNSAPTYQVTLSDGSLSTGPSGPTVTFNAINDAPTIGSISNQTTNEDTVLGPLTFTVSDSDSASLVVTAATSDGTLIPLSNIVMGGTGSNRTVAITPASDLNGGPVTITLTVSDGSLTAQTSFGVTVQPVNDPPTINNATFSVSETAANGTAVGAVVAGDIDLGDTRSFSVLSGDPLGAFAIDGTGQITVADASLLDFETQSTWTLTIQVQDAAGATATGTVTIHLIDQNDNSPIIGSNGGGSSAAISIAENTTSVTTVVATDADAGTALQYSLSGVDAGLFQIDINTGVLTFLTAPDYEFPADADGNNAYQVTVIASDGVHTDSQALTISVTEIDEFVTSPIADLNGAADTIAEDAAVGSALGITAFADDLDATDTVSYSLLSNAGGRFAIDSVTGVVTVAGALDYETSTSHTIRVQALSTDGTSTFRDFTIAVTDINEFGATSITDSDSASETLAEDLPVGSSVGVTAFADDLDGTDSISYSLLNDAGGLFTIDAMTGTVTMAQALDYETSATHTIRVQALSTDGSSTFRDFDFTITDVNEFATTPITDLNASAETIAENTVVGTPVGIIAFADDQDGTDTVSYSLLSSSGGLFAIDSVTGVVTIAGAIDYETSTSHTIRVQALSTDGSSTFRDFTVTVSDSNEFATTPITDLDPAAEVLAEDLAVGSVVGVTALADDQDGTDKVSYSLLSDAGGLFTIDATTGVVTLNAAFDYETATTHTIRVQALSTDGSSTFRDFAFVVTDVNEFSTTAVIDVDATAETIAENVSLGTVVGITAFADDLDGTDKIGYSLLNDAGGLFAVDSVTGVVTVAGAIDYETGTSHAIRVQALSTDGSSTFRDFMISVTDVNEYATTAISDANLATNSVAENSGIGTVVGVTALADDLDGTNTVSYSLDTDANGLVAIDPVTGVVTVNGLIDFETTPQLTFSVRATSTDTSFSTHSFTVDVLDRNDNAPVVTNGQSFSVAENTANGTPVGTVIATDVDTLGVLQNWQITGGTGATAFVIDAATGEITVADSTQLNFEVSTSFTLLVTVSDGVQTSAVQTITINLTDVNERPTLVGGTFTVDENSSAGTPVGAVSASDVDAGDQLSYSLVGGNPGGAFAIDPSTGAITVANPAMLDFESTNSFTLTAEVVDRGGLTHQQTVTVTLRDLNERPTLLDGTYHIPEWSLLGTSVGFVSASDVDAGDALTYRILAGNTGGRFLIDSSTGEIRLANPANFTHESQSSFTLSVEVQDLDGLAHTAQMTVLVDNVNTPPTAQDDFYSLVQFEPLVTTSIDGVLVNDSDPDSPTLTLTVISGPVNGTLTLNADGSFTYSSNDLFSGVDSFTYQISDGLETSSVATVTLTVGMVAPGGGGSGSNNDNTDTGGSGTDNGGGTTDDSGSSGGPPGVGPTTTTNPPVKVATPPRSSSDSSMTPPTESSANDEFFSNPLEPLVDLARDIGARRITRAIERPIASAILSELSAVADLIPDPVQDLTLSILENHVMWNQLNSFRDDLNSHRESTALIENIVVGTTTAVSGGLTVGYVIWLIRGGSLLATMMSIMPSWISFDPLPVMDQFEEEELTEDTESLASIVSGRR